MTKCNNHKTKYGFSMFEVCVTMAIVVVFIAACTNVFTSRHKARISTYTHGRYECYWVEKEDGTLELWEHLYNESNLIKNNAVLSVFPEDESNVYYCVFRPPANVKSVVVNAVAAGGNGGENRGGDAGQFASFYLSNLAKELSIAPGRSPRGTGTNYPSSTRIIQGRNTRDFTDKTIISLNGGRSATNDNDIYFSACAVTSNPYNCGITPTCRVDNVRNQVTVQYCVGNLENSSQNFDPNLYRSISIGYSQPNSVQISTEETWWKERDNCDESFSIEANPNHWPFGNGKPYTTICYNDPFDSGTNTCAQKKISTGLVTYSHELVACNETKRINNNNLNANDIKTIFTLNLIVGGNRTPYRQESEMDGVVSSLKISASEKGIASLRDCGTNDSGQTLRCRVSTGDGGAAGSDEDSDVRNGGHGSVLITW